MNHFDLRPDSTGGFDLVVDGRFLRARVFEDAARPQCEVSLLRRGIFSGALEEQIRRLQGELPGPFFPERVWLYFCPQCYDEGCGGISARIQVETDRVVWSEFRYDNCPDNENEAEFFEDEDTIPGLGTLVFDRTEYEDALSRTAKALGRGFVAFWRSTASLDQVSLGLEPLISRKDQRKAPTPAKSGLQWTFDGRPLSQILQATGGSLPKDTREFSTRLHFSVVQTEPGSHLETGRDTIRFLLGEGTWSGLPGRVPLFVGESLEISDGVITTHIERTDSTVHWSDFRVHDASPGKPGHAYGPGLHYAFDRQQHDEILRRILDTFRPRASV